jgi:hypothetical protein
MPLATLKAQALVLRKEWENLAHKKDRLPRCTLADVGQRAANRRCDILRRGTQGHPTNPRPEDADQSLRERPHKSEKILLGRDCRHVHDCRFKCWLLFGFVFRSLAFDCCLFGVSLFGHVSPPVIF